MKTNKGLFNVQKFCCCLSLRYGFYVIYAYCIISAILEIIGVAGLSQSKSENYLFPIFYFAHWMTYLLALIFHSGVRLLAGGLVLCGKFRHAFRVKFYKVYVVAIIMWSFIGFADLILQAIYAD